MADMTPDEREELIGIIEGLCYQFAFDSDDGKLLTGGLSTLEDAFYALGWKDPHQLPDELVCDEPLCKARGSCGWNDHTGRRRLTCHKHIGQHCPPPRYTEAPP